MSSHQPHGSIENPDVVHEESDINVRAIIWFVVVLTGVTLGVDVAMYGLFKGLDYYEVKNDPIVSPLTAPASDFAAGATMPSPGLQLTPWQDLKRFRADQLASLHGYAWIDEHSGIARVPIDKAKALLLQQGLPVRPELADTLTGTSVAASGESNGGRSIPAGEADKSSPVTAPPPTSATPASGTPAATTPPARPGAPGAPGAPIKPGGGV